MAITTNKNEIYIYKEGYCKKAGRDYDKDEIDDVQMHIANTANDHPYSFDQFQEYLDSEEFVEGYPDMPYIDWKEDLFPAARDIIIDVFASWHDDIIS